MSYMILDKCNQCENKCKAKVHKSVWDGAELWACRKYTRKKRTKTKK